MISKLYLQNFKCFSSIELNLGKITLLTGKNSSGKSSVLQSLAILNQTVVGNEWSKTVFLNGINVSLGTTGDVINQSFKGEKNVITIRFDIDDDLNIQWILYTPDRKEYDFEVDKFFLKADDTSYFSDSNDKDFYLHRLILKECIEKHLSVAAFSNKLKNLTYISADRIPPVELYDVGSNDSDIVVGSKGEFTIWILKSFDDLDINFDLMNTASNSRKLTRQAEAWLSHFFPGANLDISEIPNVNKLTLGIKSNKETGFLRPQNVGYGLTQLLPIITACLKAKRDDIILIENPEAHLHPSDQSEMGVFLSKVAATGVQLIVESHSDHILNGIRRGVLSTHELKAEDVSIYFFDEYEKKENRIIPIRIEPNGDLSDFPVDFFDQVRQDLIEIIKLSKK